MALIEIEMTAYCDIGIAPGEIGKIQPLSIALSVKLNDSFSNAAALTGQIDQTLDYSLLRDIVHSVLKERRWDLLEQICTLIRNRIEQLEQVDSARVAITKHYPWPDVSKLTLTR